MNDLKDKNSINSLIAKVLSANAKPEEIAALETWKKAAAGNMKLFENSKKIWDAKTKDFNAINLAKDRESVKQKIIQKLSLQEKSTLSILIKVAAALFIPLVLGSGYLLYDKFKVDVTPQIVSISSQHGSITECLLTDGTKVVLNKNTTLKYNTGFSVNNRSVYLEGEAYFDVEKNEKLPFIVNANKCNVTVLGTEFNVKAYANENVVETTLDEGAIQFTAKNKGKTNSLKLKPGEQVLYDIASNEIVVKEVDTFMYSAWRFGKYIFKDETLENIAAELEKLYKVNISFATTDIKQFRFRGMLEHDHNVFDALDKIEKTTDLTYEINGRSILLKKKIN